VAGHVLVDEAAGRLQHRHVLATTKVALVAL
jgi:hypothetical protein